MPVKVANNAFGTLASGITAAATSIPLTTGQGGRFPLLTASDWCYATLVDASNNLEIVKVTAISGDTLTVQRGRDGTTARAYATGDRVELRTTAALLTDIADTAKEYTDTRLPMGLISLWYGALTALPTGWALCDGKNGTPDLRDRFVVGAGTGYAVGATGGAATVTLDASHMPAHSHATTVTLSAAGEHAHTASTDTQGVHAHTYTRPRTIAGSGLEDAEGASSGSSPISTINYESVATDAQGGHAHAVTVGAAGAHTHTATVSMSNTGGNLAHENRPPYYALAYIMKL